MQHNHKQVDNIKGRVVVVAYHEQFGGVQVWRVFEAIYAPTLGVVKTSVANSLRGRRKCYPCKSIEEAKPFFEQVLDFDNPANAEFIAMHGLHRP